MKKLALLLMFATFLFASGVDGVWVNKNTRNGLINKLIIKQNGSVKAYYKCGLNSCYLGVSRYKKIKGGIVASWNKPNRFIVVTAQKLTNLSAKVITNYYYKNSNTQKTIISYFKKGNRVNYQLDYTGKWVPRNLNRSKFVKVDIKKVNGDLLVNIWGKCNGNDVCEWGKEVAKVRDNILKITYYFEDVTHKVKIKYVAYDPKTKKVIRALVQLRSIYKNSGRVVKKYFYITR